MRAIELQKKLYQEERAKKEREEKEKRKKAAYYEQVKKEYEENRLPNIQQMHMRDAELQQEIKEQKRQNKLMAEEKIR